MSLKTRTFSITLLFLLALSSVSAQDFVAYPYVHTLNWDTSPYESYSYKESDSIGSIPFRVMFPPGYDSTNVTKYPLILFFHGSGEKGTDNELQLLHGGEIAKNAVTNGEFPGILLYPQHNNGGGTWGYTWIARAKAVVDKLVADYDVDPNRIYIHGLSGGGEATWTFAELYSTLVAAMHPMSAAGSNFLSQNYEHIPIWTSQGGLDTNPQPYEGNYMVNTIRDAWGGDIRYSYYPTLGHNTWTSEYNQPDFFSWFLAREKTDILIKFGDGAFCNGDAIDVTLGVTAGFDNYQWAKDDTTSTPIFSGSSKNEINITSTGKYYVRFLRGSDWTNWSKPADINTSRAPSPTPLINSGDQSVNLPGLDGMQTVTLNGPDDKDAYQWYQDATAIIGATSIQYTTGLAGSYALSTMEPGESGVRADGVTPTEYSPAPQGCPSALSVPIIVTTQNGVNTPAKPSNFFANVLTENSIVINWDDNADNELGFELYRSTVSGSGYTLVEIIDGSVEPNPRSYIDNNLQPNTTYYYKMRAVNSSGGSAYTQEVSATTLIDTESPSAPILSVLKTTTSSIALSWTASTDNSGISNYNVYRDNAFIGSTTNTSYTNSGLPYNQSYSYTVKAVDLSGNLSQPSNQVNAVSINGGLHYDLYHTNGISNVSQITTNGTLVESENTNNFDISIRDQDDYFAFIWEGYVYIETAGSYTFYTSSDDGSKLYINNTQVVNNDGAHGTVERSGSISLSQGFAQIQVFFFENGGGEYLDVNWAGPSISKGHIPDNLLYEDSYTIPVPPTAPSNLLPTAIDYQQIDLSWMDNSNNENGFEIYRSLTSTSGYSLVYLANADDTSWSDTDVNGATTYYYKIDAINFEGASDVDGPVSVTTLDYPSAPTDPDNLLLQAISAQSVQLNWTDNSNDETGFEIYRTTTDPGTIVDSDYALGFNGTNQYVAIDNLFYNSSGIPEMTFEAWVKTTSSADQIIASFDRNEYFRVEINGTAAGVGQIGFGIMTNAGQIDLSGNTRVDDGEWHHVATVYDNGTASIYVDGILDASVTLGTTFGTGTTRYGFLGVGSKAGSFNSAIGPSYYMDGEIDEVRIWSVARTKQEIDNNKSHELTGTEQSLQLYYKILTGSGPTVYDETSTGANGTLINSVAWPVVSPSLTFQDIFTLIETTASDVTTYLDNQVSGNGTYYYRLRAVGIGTYSNFTAVQSITTPDRPPVLAPILDRSVKFQTSLAIDVIADDPDGDPITFTFTSPLPSFASFVDNGYGSGQLTFSPTSSDGGTNMIEITADDGAGMTDTVSFTLTVSNNDNPVIDPVSDVSIDEGFPTTVDVTATDAQNTTITLSADNLPSFVSFMDNGSGSGTFTILPTIGDAGIYSNIRLIAGDGEGGFTEETFQIIVNAVDPNFSIDINFSTDRNFGSSPWNNMITTNGAQITNGLLSDEGIATNIDFQSYDATNAKFNAADTAILVSGTYPDDVQETFWYKLSGTVTMRLQNLNPSLFYDLAFYAGINDNYIETVYDVGSTAGQTKTTRFTVDGATQDLDAVDNIDNTVTFTAVQPDANNEIVFTVTENGNNPYFVINALEIDAYFSSDEPPVAPSNLTATATSSSTVELTWTDNSNNETKFEILRSSVADTGPYSLVGTTPLNTSTFTDTNLIGSTLYYYKVKAKNSSGEASSQVVLVTTLNAAPIIDLINDVVIQTGTTQVVNVSSADPEDNTIFLSAPNLPSFIQFVDNGDGTGAFTFSPGSEDQGFYGSITLNAVDNFSSSSSTTFLLTVTDNQYSQTVYVNFNLNAQAAAPWNNLSSDPSTQPGFSGFTSSIGVPTTIGLNTGIGWQNAADDGLSSGNNSLIYADNVIKSYWYTTGVATITITGLDTAKYYNFDVLASTNNWDYTQSDYTMGGLSILSDATNNAEHIVAFNSIKPGVSGEATLTITPEVNAVGAYLNALIIKSSDSVVPVAPSLIKAEGVSRSEIDIEWQDNSFNETGFEIYRTDEPGKAFTLLTTTGPNVTSYKDTGHSSADAYIYKIRAISGSGNSKYTDEVSAITLEYIISININTNVQDYRQAGLPWNNTNVLPVSGFALDNLLDELNVNTGVTFYIDSIPDGQANKTGMITGDDSGIYPDDVLQAYYYLNDHEQGRYMLKNLDNTLVYDLSYFGSEGGTYTPPFGSGISDFLVGTQTRTLFTNYNIANTIDINDIAPTSKGDLTFIVKSSDDNGSRFAFFNALVVKAHQSIDVVFDKTAPTIPTDFLASNLVSTGFTLEWSASSDNVGVIGYEIYQNGVLIGTSTTESYDVIGLSPGFSYVYSVRAYDLHGNLSGFGDGLQVTTPIVTPAIMYYSATSGTIDISVASNWWSNSDGATGTHPNDFTSDNQQFLLQTDGVLSTTPLTISGLSSKLIADTNISLTLNNALTAVVEANDNSTIVVNNSTSPTFDLLSPTSTVVFESNNNSIPVAQYGNLSLISSGSTKSFSSGSIVVNGNFVVDDGVDLVGATPNASEIIVTGNMTVNGAPSIPGVDQFISINFNSGALQSLILDNDQSIQLKGLKISNGTQLTIDPLQSTGGLVLGSDVGGGLIVEDGSKLLLGSQSLTISGNGSINPNGETGVISMSGGVLGISSSSQSDLNVYFDSDVDYIQTLNVNLAALGQLNLQNKANIVTEVNITDGTVNINDTLVLISDSIQTARIAEIKNRGLVLGTVEAQRYMEAQGRVYRYLATSVKHTTVSDWQEYIPITGGFIGQSTGNGMLSNPSLYYYDESEGGWIPYPDVDNLQEMTVGRGYAIFVREATEPTTLKLSGEVTQGDFEFIVIGDTTVATDDGWNLIGNPYPSSINWSSTGWTSSGISSGVYMYDVEIGDYRTYDNQTGVGDPGFDGNIASGQAFWIQAINSAPTLAISESAKTQQVSDAAFFRTSTSSDFSSSSSQSLTPDNDFSYIMITLDGQGEKDYTHIIFDSVYTDIFDSNSDIVKKLNDNLNLFTLTTDSISTAINKLNVDFCDISIPIELTQIDPGTYNFIIDLKKDNFSFDPKIQLVDLLMNTTTIVNSDVPIQFTIQEGDSLIANRFALSISKPEIITNIDINQSTDSLCQNDIENYNLILDSTQRGVKYEILIDNEKSGITITGDGTSRTMSLDNYPFLEGDHQITIEGEFSNCSHKTLDQIINVSIIPPPEVSVDKENINVCSGSAMEIVAYSNDENTIFSWKVNDDIQANEQTSKFILDNVVSNLLISVNGSNEFGCTASSNIEVNVVVENMDSPVLSESNGLLNASIENADNYQWFLNNEILAGDSLSYIDNPLNGMYQVEVTLGACTKLSDEYLITALDHSLSTFINIYPNPTENSLYIENNSFNIENVYVINSLGEQLTNYTWIKNNDNYSTLDLTNLNSGIYIVRLASKDTVVNVRVIKK